MDKTQGETSLLLVYIPVKKRDEMSLNFLMMLTLAAYAAPVAFH